MLELNQREKILVLLGAVILLPLIIYNFVFVTVQDSQDKLATKITSTERKIKKVDQLGQELLYYERRGGGRIPKLSMRIDKTLRNLQLKGNSRVRAGDTKKGGQHLVLTLTDINLTELTKLVYQIENSNPVILIENVDISPSYRNKKLLRVTITVASQ